MQLGPAAVQNGHDHHGLDDECSGDAARRPDDVDDIFPAPRSVVRSAVAFCCFGYVALVTWVAFITVGSIGGGSSGGESGGGGGDVDAGGTATETAATATTLLVTGDEWWMAATLLWLPLGAILGAVVLPVLVAPPTTPGRLHLAAARAVGAICCGVGLVGALAHFLPPATLRFLVLAQVSAVGLAGATGFELGYFVAGLYRAGLMRLLPPAVVTFLTETTLLDFLTDPTAADFIADCWNQTWPLMLDLVRGEDRNLVLQRVDPWLRDRLLRPGLLWTLPAPVQAALNPVPRPMLENILGGGGGGGDDNARGGDGQLAGGAAWGGPPPPQQQQHQQEQGQDAAQIAPAGGGGAQQAAAAAFVAPPPPRRVAYPARPSLLYVLFLARVRKAALALTPAWRRGVLFGGTAVWVVYFLNMLQRLRRGGGRAGGGMALTMGNMLRQLVAAAALGATVPVCLDLFRKLLDLEASQRIYRLQAARGRR
eukprot:g3739.t1